jgi:hypothetical protein
MLKFTKFLALTASLLESKPRNNTGTYVAVYPNEKTISRLCTLCMELDLSDMIDDDKLHATVLYSRKGIDHPQAEKIADEYLPIEAIGDEYAVFGHEGEEKCLVLKLSSVGLRGLHAEYRNMGGTSDYPTYEAHVTLCYGIPENYPLPKEKPCVPLTFTRAKVNKIDRDAI